MIVFNSKAERFSSNLEPYKGRVLKLRLLQAFVGFWRKSNLSLKSRRKLTRIGIANRLRYLCDSKILSF